MRVEHWDNALDRAPTRPGTLLAGEGRGRGLRAGAVVLVRPVRPQDPAGRPARARATRSRSCRARSRSAASSRSSAATAGWSAAFGMNRPAPIMRYRARIAEGLALGRRAGRGRGRGRVSRARGGGERAGRRGRRATVGWCETVTRAEMRGAATCATARVFVVVRRPPTATGCSCTGGPTGRTPRPAGGTSPSAASSAAGEAWDDAAARELEEEAGVRAPLEPLGDGHLRGRRRSPRSAASTGPAATARSPSPTARWPRSAWVELDAAARVARRSPGVPRQRRRRAARASRPTVVNAAAWVLLARHLACAVANWVAVRLRARADDARVRRQAGDDGGPDRGGARARPVRSARCGPGSSPRWCSASPATCS